MYADVFHRKSVDGRGTPITVTVHYGQDYDNAFWDGRQMVFGDGDDRIFDRFTKPMDVMAHEFTHGVTENTAGLSYAGQPGCTQRECLRRVRRHLQAAVNGQTAEEADWLIGQGLFKPSVSATALRSMEAPGTA